MKRSVVIHFCLHATASLHYTPVSASNNNDPIAESEVLITGCCIKYTFLYLFLEWRVRLKLMLQNYVTLLSHFACLWHTLRPSHFGRCLKSFFYSRPVTNTLHLIIGRFLKHLIGVKCWSTILPKYYGIP